MDRYVFQIDHIVTVGGVTTILNTTEAFKEIRRAVIHGGSTLHLYLDFCVGKTTLFPGLPSLALCPPCFFPTLLLIHLT